MAAPAREVPRMQINPPFGYTEIVPLLKTHRVRLLQRGEVPGFVRKLNAIPISFTEFALVARDYPIVFTSGDGGKSYAPVAVLGMAAGENLFAPADGWAPGAYVPAYARRYPFCMARVNLNQVEQQNRMVCVEKASVDAEGAEAVFDEKGEPTAKWRDMQRLLAEYEADLERGRELCGCSPTTRCSSPSRCRPRSTRAANCSSPACTASTRRKSSTSTPASSRTWRSGGSSGASTPTCCRWRTSRACSSAGRRAPRPSCDPAHSPG
jgi:hypothetical protein